MWDAIVHPTFSRIGSASRGALKLKALHSHVWNAKWRRRTMSVVSDMSKWSECSVCANLGFLPCPSFDQFQFVGDGFKKFCCSHAEIVESANAGCHFCELFQQASELLISSKNDKRWYQIELFDQSSVEVSAFELVADVFPSFEIFASSGGSRDNRQYTQRSFS